MNASRFHEIYSSKELSSVWSLGQWWYIFSRQHHDLPSLFSTVMWSVLTGCNWIPVFYMKWVHIWPPQASYYWVIRILTITFGMTGRQTFRPLTTCNDFPRSLKGSRAFHAFWGMKKTRYEMDVNLQKTKLQNAFFRVKSMQFSHFLKNKKFPGHFIFNYFCIRKKCFWYILGSKTWIEYLINVNEVVLEARTTLFTL